MVPLVRQPLLTVSTALHGSPTSLQHSTSHANRDAQNPSPPAEGSKSPHKGVRKRLSMALTSLGGRSPTNQECDAKDKARKGDASRHAAQRESALQKLEGLAPSRHHQRTKSTAPAASRLLGSLDTARLSSPNLTLRTDEYTESLWHFSGLPTPPLSHLERRQHLTQQPFRHDETDDIITLTASSPQRSEPDDAVDGQTRSRPTSSVTFVDSLSPRISKEEGRMPYRERKLSESVLSLTEVKEEEEPAHPSHDTDMHRQRRRLSAIQASESSQVTDMKRIAPIRRQSARIPSPLPPDEFDSFRDRASKSAAMLNLPPPVPFPRSAGAGDLSFDAAARKQVRRKPAPSVDERPLSFSSSPNGKASSHIRFPTDMNAARPLLMTRKTEFASAAEQRQRQRRVSEFDGAFANKAMSSSLSRSDSTTSSSTKEKLVLVEDGASDVVFQLGNCIGRGQFGSVYRALNLTTGQMVAVKRITLVDRGEEEISELMGEVDLLRSLSHASVVKYEGLVRDHDNVSIILEYVENGSLLHTLKAFGSFPEKLVASYVAKILEGLIYLHDMRVVHCDLKAANILSTKNGNVKLSDFGVSLNLKAAQDLKHNDAVGTPNWMAPEVIELKGASPAADVWSLGCTIVEFLTSKPPYSELNSMSAMFRIVEDDCPPLPANASEDLQDFLRQCFRKDPVARPSAQQLLQHAWLAAARDAQRSLRPRESVPAFERYTASEAASPRTIQTHIFPPPVVDFDRSDRRMSATEALPKTRRAHEMSAHSPRVRYSQLSASPTPSVTVDLLSRRNSEVASSNTSIDMLRSPSLMATMEQDRETHGIFHNNFSTYDVTGPDAFVESGKAHAFVKSSFSKRITCKVCRETVKKHAVLCEECGLICHTSCTRRIATPCTLRSQIRVVPDDAVAQTTARASPVEAGDSSPRFSVLHATRSPLAKLKRYSSQSKKNDDKAQAASASLALQSSPLQMSTPPINSPSFAQQQRIMPFPSAEPVAHSTRGRLTSISTTSLAVRGGVHHTPMRSDGSTSSATSVIDHGARSMQEAPTRPAKPPVPSRFRSRYMSTDALPMPAQSTKNGSNRASRSSVQLAQPPNAGSASRGGHSRSRLVSMPTPSIFRSAPKPVPSQQPEPIVTAKSLCRNSKRQSKVQECVAQ